MESDFVSTTYGPISVRFAMSVLSDLCVADGGVQTGPFGSQLHASDYVADGTPIITVEHLGDNRIVHTNLPRVTDKDKKRLAKYTLTTGDIVFSRVGSVDRRAIVHAEEDGWLFSGRCLRVRPDQKKIDPGYLSWFFGFAGFQEHIRQIAVGATMPSLNTKILSDVPIYYPPSIAEQQAIASILGAFDDKIELNRRMDRTLEEMARTIFKSWFIDFDPVHAKANGRDTGLPTEIAALFPDSFENSELGEIPKGWSTASFTDSIEVIGGGTPKRSRSEYWGGSIPWFSVVDTPADGEVFAISTKQTVTQLGIDNSSARILPVGTTIISARGTVGNLALVGVPMAMNQSCYGLRDQRNLKGYFLYFATEAVVDTLRQRGHGSVFNTITRDTLHSLRVASPPDKVASAFERVVQSLMLRLLVSQQESRALAALRDTLLPKLISGELRVPDAERVAGRVL